MWGAPNVIIEDFTPESVNIHVESFLEMDRDAIAMGYFESWSRAHFERTLPGKWALSLVATERGVPVGYRVMSLCGKIPGYAHSHRTVVREKYKRQGLGKWLFEESLRRVIREDARGITGLIHPNNDVSKAFYSSFGFRFFALTKNGNEVWSLDL